MITFISGGARSGKSSFAEKYSLNLFKQDNKNSTLLYIATAERTDREMEERINRHIEERDSIWQTVEAPLDILAILEKTKGQEVILLDCLTVWLNNMMFKENIDLVSIIANVSKWIQLSRQKQIELIIVSNDLNEGMPIDHIMVHEYIYNLEKVHRTITESAESVYQVVAGIPIKWKG